MDEDLKLLFLKIIENNRQKILRICQAYARNKEDQKDLYPGSCVEYLEVTSFLRRTMINTWIYRISLNICMRFSIKSKKENRANFAIEGISILDESRDLQINIETNEKINQLYACIAKLDDAEKSLVLLFLEDLSHRAISDITGITENHVAVKLSRIKKKLFNCINN